MKKKERKKKTNERKWKAAGRHQVDGKTTTTVHVRQQPLAQPRKPRAKELALLRSVILPGWERHVGAGQYPQYHRADFGPEAVGSSIHIRYTSPNVQPYGRVKVPQKRKKRKKENEKKKNEKIKTVEVIVVLGSFCGCCTSARVLCAWRHSQLSGLPTASSTLTALVYRGYWLGPTSVMLHPGRVVETSERQPCVVGVVVVVSFVSVSLCVLHSDKNNRKNFFKNTKNKKFF